MRILTIQPAAVLAFGALAATLFVPMLGGAAALGFLAAGALLVLSRPRFSLTVLRREGLFVAFALWCLLSTLWSDYPALSLRHGIQLTLTILVALVIAYRLSPGQFVRVAASAYLVAGLASLASGRARADGEGYLGIFNSKNALAAASAMMLVAGLSLFADRRQSWLWRLAGGGLLGVGGLLIVKAKSVGALASIGVVLLAYLLAIGLRRLAPLPRLVLLATGGLVVLLGLLLAWAEVDAISAALLDVTGKDVTLTGRTDLWRVALAEIGSRPILGAGYQAVWVHGNPLAEQLWAQFGIESRRGFNFHNALLSSAVEIGIIGAALQALLVLGAVGPLLGWVMRDRSAGVLFLALIIIRVVVMMVLEVEFFIQFDAATVMIVAAIAYSHRRRREGRPPVAGVSAHRGTRSPPGPW